MQCLVNIEQIKGIYRDFITIIFWPIGLKCNKCLRILFLNLIDFHDKDPSPVLLCLGNLHQTLQR